MNLPNVTIWCDGACRGNPGVGGWGVILDHPKKRLELTGGETNTTNNRMELTAAIEGLKALRMPAKVTVHSDSKYVVRGMAEWVAGWIKKGWRKADRKPVANKDLWIELVSVAGKHEVTWEWVEGHTGDEMNELADTLANQGADEVEQAGYCLLDLLFFVVALLFLSSVAAFGIGGEAIFAAAPLFSRAQRNKRQDELAHAEPNRCDYTTEKKSTERLLAKALQEYHSAEAEYNEACSISGDDKLIVELGEMVNFCLKKVEGFEKNLEKIEKNLTPPTTWSSKSGKAHYPNECGSRQKHYWICHPECTPKCCSHGHKDEGREIFRHSPITIWWRS